MTNVEYKENISIDDVKTGEIIRTDNYKEYLVIKMPRDKVRFVEFDSRKNSCNLTGKIIGVYKPNGKARILPCDKEL